MPQDTKRTSNHNSNKKFFVCLPRMHNKNQFSDLRKYTESQPSSVISGTGHPFQANEYNQSIHKKIANLYKDGQPLSWGVREAHYTVDNLKKYGCVNDMPVDSNGKVPYCVQENNELKFKTCHPGELIKILEDNNVREVHDYGRKVGTRVFNAFSSPAYNRTAPNNIVETPTQRKLNEAREARQNGVSKKTFTLAVGEEYNIDLQALEDDLAETGVFVDSSNILKTISDAKRREKKSVKSIESHRNTSPTPYGYNYFSRFLDLLTTEDIVEAYIFYKSQGGNANPLLPLEEGGRKPVMRVDTLNLRNRREEILKHVLKSDHTPYKGEDGYDNELKFLGEKLQELVEYCSPSILIRSNAQRIMDYDGKPVHEKYTYYCAAYPNFSSGSDGRALQKIKSLKRADEQRKYLVSSYSKTFHIMATTAANSGEAFNTVVPNAFLSAFANNEVSIVAVEQKNSYNEALDCIGVALADIALAASVGLYSGLKGMHIHDNKIVREAFIRHVNKTLNPRDPRKQKTADIVHFHSGDILDVSKVSNTAVCIMANGKEKIGNAAGTNSAAMAVEEAVMRHSPTFAMSCSTHYNSTLNHASLNSIMWDSFLRPELLDRIEKKFSVNMLYDKKYGFCVVPMASSHDTYSTLKDKILKYASECSANNIRRAGSPISKVESDAKNATAERVCNSVNGERKTNYTGQERNLVIIPDYLLREIELDVVSRTKNPSEFRVSILKGSQGVKKLAEESSYDKRPIQAEPMPELIIPKRDPDYPKPISYPKAPVNPNKPRSHSSSRASSPRVAKPKDIIGFELFEKLPMTPAPNEPKLESIFTPPSHQATGHTAIPSAPTLETIGMGIDGNFGAGMQGGFGPGVAQSYAPTPVHTPAHLNRQKEKNPRQLRGTNDHEKEGHISPRNDFTKFYIGKRGRSPKQPEEVNYHKEEELSPKSGVTKFHIDTKRRQKHRQEHTAEPRQFDSGINHVEYPKPKNNKPHTGHRRRHGHRQPEEINDYEREQNPRQPRVVNSHRSTDVHFEHHIPKPPVHSDKYHEIHRRRAQRAVHNERVLNEQFQEVWKNHSDLSPSQENKLNKQGPGVLTKEYYAHFDSGLIADGPIPSAYFKRPGEQEMREQNVAKAMKKMPKLETQKLSSKEKNILKEGEQAYNRYRTQMSEFQEQEFTRKANIPARKLEVHYIPEPPKPQSPTKVEEGGRRYHHRHRRYKRNGQEVQPALGGHHYDSRPNEHNRPRNEPRKEHIAEPYYNGEYRNRDTAPRQEPIGAKHGNPTQYGESRFPNTSANHDSGGFELEHRAVYGDKSRFPNANANTDCGTPFHQRLDALRTKARNINSNESKIPPAREPRTEFFR